MRLVGSRPFPMINDIFGPGSKLTLGMNTFIRRDKRLIEELTRQRGRFMDCSKSSLHILDALPTRVGLPKGGNKYRTIYEVWDIKAACPVYKKGDRIIFDDDKINFEESSFVCPLAVTSFSTRFAWIRGDEDAVKAMEEDGDVWVSCTAPGPPYSKYGRVIFKAHRVPMKE